MHVIGTAGHVDHGKSTLIAALTGVHPDRLKEEQEREMTIDLGFGWMTLPSAGEVGFIDVPGHRDFIENMLAGVSGIDAALLVIAADEGVMPQTREHLSILDLLQVPSGLVVFTKIDLVDEAGWLDLVETDARALLNDTILKDAPILRVSSRTGQGLPELVQALDLLLKDRPARPDLGRPRLPVDRVFSMPGFGTVVTGTLADGRLALGEEVEFLPSGSRGRVRGLQTHKHKTEVALPGARTAVNISGLDASQVQRGEVLAHPDQYHSTRRVDVQFRLLKDAPMSLRHHMEVKLFTGTSESVAMLRLLGAESLEPGEEGWLQLELHTPIVAVRGDRFILRRPSPGLTLGGGVVVDPRPKRRHKRFDEAVLASLESLIRGTPAEVLLQAALALGPALVRDVTARSRLEGARAEAALKELLANGQLIGLEDLVISASHWSAMKETTHKILSAYHQAYPLRRGMPREELKSRLKLQPRLFNLILPRLADEGILQENPKWVALPGHVVKFSPFQQVKVDRLMKLFEAAPTAPPSIKECLVVAGEDVFSALVEAGDLVTASEEVVFRNSDYQAMVEKVCAIIKERGSITLAEVRDLFSTSRKYAQAFLEHLDSTGVTLRDGDSRRLR